MFQRLTRLTFSERFPVVLIAVISLILALSALSLTFGPRLPTILW